MIRTPTFAGALVVATNGALVVTKLAVGLLSGSVAVLSDAIDSGEDLVAATVTLISVRLSARPPDERHPYGYGKVESVAAGVEAGFISLGAAFITIQAVDAFVTGSDSIDTTLGIVTMSVVAAVNVALALFVRGVARAHGSFALSANATHLFTNAVQAAAVITALTLVATTGQSWFDPLVALLLASYLVWMAFRILRRAYREMTDVRLPAREEEEIAAVIREHDGDVRGYHRLRTRRAGPYREIDLHLILAPDSQLAEVHSICDRIEDEIEARFPQSTVVIHAEPDDGRWLGPLANDAPPVVGGAEPN